MCELWSEQKEYIDTAAACEAYKVGSIVLSVVFVASLFYAMGIYTVSSKIAQLDKRVKVLEEGR
jgi:hypothetical protein